MSTSQGCGLCGRELSENPVSADEGQSFCSQGCRNVHTTLGVADIEESDIGKNQTATRRAGSSEEQSQEHSTAFLYVDGMHCATCELFLESVADNCAAVTESEASYVTETIRVDYDPNSISLDELCERLTGAGYRAVPRSETAKDTAAADQLEETHPADRGIDELLGFRYAAGVIFGTFMLLPYVVAFYPAQLPSVFGEQMASMFEGGVYESGGLILLPVFLFLTAVVVFFTGMPILQGAYVSLRMRRPNTDLLVAVTMLSAFLYGTVAFLLGRVDIYYDLTIVVAATVVAATFYESLIKQRAMDHLTNLTVSQVDSARIYEDDETTTVAVEELEPGDRLLVKQGERFPVDGVLDEGHCTVDESVVTGESLPVPKQAGDTLVGGSVVTDDAAVARVGEEATSSIDRLTTSVWDLQSGIHGLQRRTDTWAARVVPVLAVGAVIVAITVGYIRESVLEALLSFLTVFIVGCPWALGLSTPVSVATSIRDALARGVVVFDETVFDRLNETDIVVFDKTGTLTTGEMKVVDKDAPDELLAAVGSLEQRASHPAADAIATEFGSDRAASGDSQPRTDGGSTTRKDGVTQFQSHAMGIEGKVDGTNILVGSLDLFDEQGWTVSEAIEQQALDARGFGRLPVVVGQDGQAEGVIVVGDEPREGWEQTIGQLNARNVDTVVLTGDDEEATEFFRSHPGVEHVFAGVRPAGKTATVKRLKTENYVTMVGDGTNDAPALACADLGIALGGGTALASDAADLAVVGDELPAVEDAFDLARGARRRVTQNTALALLYNVVTIPLAVLGVLNPLFVMAAVLLSGGLIGLNSVRKQEQPNR